MKNNISKKLKIARQNAGYATAKDFAKKFDLPMATYYQHEAGKRNPKLDIIKKYCSLLNLSIEYFTHPFEKEYYNKAKKEGPIYDEKLMNKRTVMITDVNINKTKNNVTDSFLDEISKKLSSAMNKNKTTIDPVKFLKICSTIYFEMKQLNFSFERKTQIIDIVINILTLSLK